MTQTPFELAQEQAEKGLLKVPTVSTGDSNVDYFGYQLSVHKMNLKLMSLGMTTASKLKDFKDYYGLKGRSEKDVLPQFMVIFDKYYERFK